MTDPINEVIGERKFAVGDHVFIIRASKVFTARGGDTVVLKKVPGIVTELRADGSLLVAYRGRPHHLTPKGKDVGTWSEPANQSDLIHRDPNPDDPLEFQ